MPNRYHSLPTKHFQKNQYNYIFFQLVSTSDFISLFKNLCKQIVPKIIHFLKQEPYEM